MYHDEVIDELRRIRDEYAAEHHNNLKEIVDDLKKRQLKPFGPLVNRRKKRGLESPPEN